MFFDGDFYNEFSATDILLGPGDLCSHVILVERRHFDVHAFYHSRSPLMSAIRSAYLAYNGAFYPTGTQFYEACSDRSGRLRGLFPAFA